MPYHARRNEFLQFREVLEMIQGGHREGWRCFCASLFDASLMLRCLTLEAFLKNSILLFVGFVKIEEGLDICPMAKATVALHLFQLGGVIVAPASLHQKCVEH